LKISATPGSRNSLQTYSRQYERPILVLEDLSDIRDDLDYGE